MNIVQLLVVVLAQIETEVNPSPTSVGLELSIWKWVVIIGVSAFVAIFATKRIADVMAKRKTEQMIDEVVGKGASATVTDWVDDNDDD